MATSSSTDRKSGPRRKVALGPAAEAPLEVYAAVGGGLSDGVLWNLRTDRLSALNLLIVNLIPVAGVLLFHWDVTRLMLFYCAENIVIGWFNAAKMIAAGFAHGVSGVFSATFCVPLFVIHYGLFCLGHGFLILTIGAMSARGWQTPIPLSAVFEPLIRQEIGFWGSLASMAILHGMAFVHDWLAKDQARRTTPYDLMFEPYGRIGVLHLSLLGGMALVLILKQPVGAVVMLGVAKTVFELVQRKPLAARAVGISKNH